MVTHLGTHRSIDLFFANYKSANVKKVRSFSIFFSPQILLLVKAFYRANLIYSFTLNEFGNSIVLYPRFSARFKNFQVIYKAHSPFQSVTKLKRYQNLGYNFIIFTPFHTTKFLTSTEFSTFQAPGYLLAIW